MERLGPSQYAKAEVQIALNSASGETNHWHVITISLEEVQRLEAESAPIREAAGKMLEEYEQRRNGSSPPER